MDGHFHVSEVKIRGSGGYFQRRPLMLQGLLKGKPRVGFLVDIVAIEAQSAIQKINQ